MSSGIHYRFKQFHSPGGMEATNLVRRAISGSTTEVLAERTGIVGPTSWSRDRRLLLFDPELPERGSDVFVIRVDTVGEPVEWLSTSANEWGAEFSPDGQWVGYTSDESGQYQVYVEPFERTGDRYRISAHDNSEEPLWSADGSTLYYRSGNRWWGVNITLEPSFEAGAPQLVIEGSFLNVGGRSYDLHPDGERFLLIDTPREETADRIHVVQNWFEELRQRMGN